MDCYVNRSVEVAMPDEPKISPCPVCGKRCKGDGFSFTIDCTWCAYRVSSPATHERICAAMNRDNHALAVTLAHAIVHHNKCVFRFADFVGEKSQRELLTVIEAALEGRKGGE